MNKNLKIPVLTLITIIVCSILSKQVSAQTKTTIKTVTKKTTVVHKTVYKKPSAAELAQGKALFTKSDCLTCHKLDVKLVGPAYYDVAKKYPASEANYEKLADKVIKGGSGNWGQIPMAPHANLTHDDAKKIIEYVLSLKPGKS